MIKLTWKVHCDKVTHTHSSWRDAVDWLSETRLSAGLIQVRAKMKLYCGSRMLKTSTTNPIWGTQEGWLLRKKGKKQKLFWNHEVTSFETQDGDLDITHCPDHQTANITPPSTHTTYQIGFYKQCARLTKPLVLVSESLWFQGSWQFGINTYMWKDWTSAPTQWRAGLSHLSQCLWHWLPARDIQVSGWGDKPFSSLQNLHSTKQHMHLEKHCTSPSLLRTTHQSESVRHLENAQHQLSPTKLRIPIPWYTSYNTISPSYMSLPRVMTVLGLQTSLILVVGFHAVWRCTISEHRRTARSASLGSQWQPAWTFSQKL